MWPRRQGEWLVLLRAALVGVAAVTVGLTSFPPSYTPWAWVVVAFFAAVTIVSAALTRIELDRAARGRARALLIGCDALVGIGVVAVFSYQAGEPYRALYLIPVAEAALRFGLVGGVLGGAVMTGATIVIDALGPGVQWRAALVRILVGMLAGIVIGRLRDGISTERQVAEERAAEAERLRDELGHRADVLETANRVARALASSLELEEAFGAFIRELAGLVPFERTAIVLVDGDTATTMATAGRGAMEIFPPGNTGPLGGSVLEQVLQGRIVVRHDLEEREYPEDELLLGLGLRSELVSPLMLGARPIGMLTLSRERPDAFSEDETELVALLGRLVATAVQNIRAYEAERRRVEELARLSALRADFVSLVSHELRSPMAAVIGAARTLHDRWRMLTTGQRESFLALIADETDRLAALVEDVLDTSRLEAGTFSYRFDDVDLARLVEEAVDSAGLAQPDVRVVAALHGKLPTIRGDAVRLRQVLGNLIDNAVKYSPESGEVQVAAAAYDGRVRISVRDAGPGIPREQQGRIFEKFERADVPGSSKPGTGLGLFIARSIAEAHGGTLDVDSVPREGATFVLTLPVG
ncbi:MAG TPA: ATP-binding protein [Gaiellaceae bacterium]|nr:ATP-binding protein [Gaiellaceae bacterium]